MTNTRECCSACRAYPQHLAESRRKRASPSTPVLERFHVQRGSHAARGVLRHRHAGRRSSDSPAAVCASSSRAPFRRSSSIRVTTRTPRTSTRSRGRIAMSDGASESYDSKTWSNLLVRRFVRDPRVGPRGFDGQPRSSPAGSTATSSPGRSRRRSIAGVSQHCSVSAGTPASAVVDCWCIGDSLGRAARRERSRRVPPHTRMPPTSSGGLSSCPPIPA